MDFKKMSPEELMKQDDESMDALKTKTQEAIMGIVSKMNEITSRDERQLLVKDVLDETTHIPAIIGAIQLDLGVGLAIPIDLVNATVENIAVAFACVGQIKPRHDRHPVAHFSCVLHARREFEVWRLRQFIAFYADRNTTAKHCDCTASACGSCFKRATQAKGTSWSPQIGIRREWSWSP